MVAIRVHAAVPSQPVAHGDLHTHEHHVCGNVPLKTSFSHSAVAGRLVLSQGVSTLSTFVERY